MQTSLLLLFLSATTGLDAADWSRFRGPNGDGIPADDRAPADFSLEKNLAWKTKIPGGHSSPILVKDRIFLSGYEADQRLLLSLDAATGKELWRTTVTKVRTEAVNPLNGPATPTPTSDGSSLFVLFPEFGLVSYTWEGKERWRVPLGPFDSVQGIATSPVYTDGIVAILIDQPTDSYVLAFDAKTGKQRWKADRPSGFLGGYSTPSIYKPAKGPTQLVVSGGPELTGYQATTGERLWFSRAITKAPAALPLIHGDTLYAMEPRSEGAPEPFSRVAQYDPDKDGKIELAKMPDATLSDKIWSKILASTDRHYGNKDGFVDEAEWLRAFGSEGKAGGLQAVKLGANARGELPESAIQWRVDKGMPYVTAPLYYRDVLYIVRNGGILTSYNPESGEILLQQRVKDALGDYYASPVAAGGRLYLINKEGKLSVLKAAAQWEVLSAVDLNEQVIATPALANGRLYVRTAGALYCFGG
jgi:outer membrane protein assembly factor BamB